MKEKSAKPKETKCFDKDQKPKLSLREFEVLDSGSSNVAGNLYGQDEKVDVKKLSTKLQTKIINMNSLEMEFDLIGFDPAIVNALRRILISDVPSMAIEKVHMYQVFYMIG